MIWALAVACALVSAPAGLRWLRIAQREHYLAPSVTRFAWRWWNTTAWNRAILVMALVGVVGTWWSVWFGFLVVAAQVGPVGLAVRGAGPAMAWTPRMRRLASVSGGIVVVIYLMGVVTSTPFVPAIGLALLPMIVDTALTAMSPVESRRGGKWVERAARKLDSIGADVVAITGSYGKTTTKGYVAHLLAGSCRVVASPASFNNRMGLARAINEMLTPGTQVFVAEMGTYGPGEIAELCAWIPPRVAAMVSIGPVHLERFKTEERIVAAKAEILERAEIGVICVDHPLLARLAEERSHSMGIVEVSTGDRGRVRVGDSVIEVDGVVVADTPSGVFAANLAVALGVCLGLDMDLTEVVERVDGLPGTRHRQSVHLAEGGFSIIDDTFNSNPAGARRGLDVLQMVGAGGKKAVVTPGMVELGPVQDRENEVFATLASEAADHLVIVGATNRKSLMRGSKNGRASVTVVRSRDEGVAWARENLGPGDAVLYENDLPDHYP